jgi:hypothetical protein
VCASRSDLLCPSSNLLQLWLQQLLQEVLLLQDAKDQVPQDPLLQGSQELLQHGMLDRLCSNVRRSSCLRSCLRPDLCRSSCLLPLSCADEDDRVT